MNQAKFITFEGIDGAGKSTHLAFVADALRAAGCQVLVTQSPAVHRLVNRYAICCCMKKCIWKPKPC